MPERAQILPGTLDLLILKAVSLGPLYGYGILLLAPMISNVPAFRARRPSDAPGSFDRHITDGWSANLPLSRYGRVARGHNWPIVMPARG